MARLAGVDLPRNKHMVIALTYIHGIGRTSARKILDLVGLPYATNSDDLSENDVTNIRKIMDDQFVVEGDRRREVAMDVKRLTDAGCYRGIRRIVRACPVGASGPRPMPGQGKGRGVQRLKVKNRIK